MFGDPALPELSASLCTTSMSQHVSPEESSREDHGCGSHWQEIKGALALAVTPKGFL